MLDELICGVGPFYFNRCCSTGSLSFHLRVIIDGCKSTTERHLWPLRFLLPEEIRPTQPTRSSAQRACVQTSRGIISWIRLGFNISPLSCCRPILDDGQPIRHEGMVPRLVIIHITKDCRTVRPVNCLVDSYVQFLLKRGVYTHADCSCGELQSRHRDRVQWGNS